jgi:hypothetical protein
MASMPDRDESTIVQCVARPHLDCSQYLHRSRADRARAPRIVVRSFRQTTA